MFSSIYKTGISNFYLEWLTWREMITAGSMWGLDPQQHWYAGLFFGKWLLQRVAQDYSPASLLLTDLKPRTGQLAITEWLENMLHFHICLTVLSIMNSFSSFFFFFCSFHSLLWSRVGLAVASCRTGTWKARAMWTISRTFWSPRPAPRSIFLSFLTGLSGRRALNNERREFPNVLWNNKTVRCTTLLHCNVGVWVQYSIINDGKTV